MNPEDNAINDVRTTLLAWPGLRCLEPSDREDLVHDVISDLLKSHRPGPALNDNTIDQYAVGMLRNRRALLLRRRLLQRRFAKECRDKSVAPLVDTTAPIESLAQKERAALLTDVISRMPELDGAILNLRRQGRTLAEIATELEKPAPTVRQRYVRALQKIRNAYFREE